MTKSIKLVQDFSRSEQPIGIVTQKDNEVEDPMYEDLYHVGTMAHILRFITLPDGNITIIVQGIKRFDLVTKEFPNVDIGLQIVHLEHLALLAVLDAKPVEFCVECQQVDADTVNLDVGLQLVLKEVRSLLKHLLLEGSGIDDEKSYYQQDSR